MQVQVAGDAGQARDSLLQDAMLNEIVHCKLLALDVVSSDSTQFVRHPRSGKIPLVIDRRRQTT